MDKLKRSITERSVLEKTDSFTNELRPTNIEMYSEEILSEAVEQLGVVTEMMTLRL